MSVSPAFAPFGAGHDVYDDIAAVFSALLTGAVRKTQSTAFAFRDFGRQARGENAAVRSGERFRAFDYHMGDNIRDLWALGKGHQNQ